MEEGGGRCDGMGMKWEVLEIVLLPFPDLPSSPGVLALVSLNLCLLKNKHRSKETYWGCLGIIEGKQCKTPTTVYAASQPHGMKQ